MDSKDVYSGQVPASFTTATEGMVTRPGVANHKCKGKGCKVCAKAKLQGKRFFSAGGKSFEESLADYLELKAGTLEGGQRAATSRRDNSRYIGTSRLGDIRLANNEPITIQVDIKSLEGKLFGLGKKPRDGDGDGVPNEGAHGNGRRGVSHRSVRKAGERVLPGADAAAWDRWAGDNSARQKQVAKMRKKAGVDVTHAAPGQPTHADPMVKGPKTEAMKRAEALMANAKKPEVRPLPERAKESGDPKRDATRARYEAAQAKPGMADARRAMQERWAKNNDHGKGKPKAPPKGVFPPKAPHGNLDDKPGSWHSIARPHTPGPEKPKPKGDGLFPPKAPHGNITNAAGSWHHRH